MCVNSPQTVRRLIRPQRTEDCEFSDGPHQSNSGNCVLVGKIMRPLRQPSQMPSLVMLGSLNAKRAISSLRMNTTPG